MAAVVIRRRVHWFDTDTSSKHHNTAPLRYMEEAEAELLDRLGIVREVYGHLPRRRVEIDYHRPVRFWDQVEVGVEVLAVGRTSITYSFWMDREAERCAEGRVVAVFIDEDGRPRPWPDEYRSLLEGGEPAGA
jgi:acyl-CoA thioester hydrolase